MSPPTGQKTNYLGYQIEYSYGISPIKTPLWDMLRQSNWTLNVNYQVRPDGTWEVTETVITPPAKHTRRGHRHKLRMPELEIGDLE